VHHLVVGRNELGMHVGSAEEASMAAVFRS
jgi:hypothetical protein